MLVNVVMKKRDEDIINMLQKLLDYVPSSLKIRTKKLEINIEFVSKKQIKNINKEFRSVNAVTDVLSFPTINLQPSDLENLPNIITLENCKNDINPITKNIVLGDIIVCLPIAKKQARKYGHSVEREVGYLVAHSMLHLLGFNHDNEENKKSMREYEEKIMKKLNLSR